MDASLIANIVKEVVRNIDNGSTLNTASGNYGIFETMNEAIEAAYIAQKKYQERCLEHRKNIVCALRENLRPLINEMSERTVRETKIGRVSDKINKNKLVLDKTPGVEDLATLAFTGDDGLSLVEYSPFGVIGAIAPVTNATETIMCNAIGMLSAGNSVVFSPHPSAINVSNWLIAKINEIIVNAGGEVNLITAISKSSMEEVDCMMSHPKVNVLCVTGGMPVVRKALSSGKKTIGAGAGNPPSIVDETANVEQAARDIVAGASLDNNVPCIAEKSVVVVESVADYLIFNMEKNNVFKLTNQSDIDKLLKAAVHDNHPNKDFVGKDAKYILDKVGIACNYDPRLIIVEVDNKHPFVQVELMMPILPIVRCKDFDTALEWALDIEHGYRHTATMHSKNVDRLTLAARKFQTTIFVKNGPSFAGIGLGGEGHTSFTLASSTGDGITSASTFCRKRRCVLKGGFSIR